MLVSNRKINGSNATVTSLPENIKIINSALYSEKMSTSQGIFSINSKSRKAVNDYKIQGSVWGEYNAFSVEFPSNFDPSAQNSDVNIKTLYSYVYNDGFSNINKEKLNQMFYIYEVDDPSFHTGTMNNYDIQAKVFYADEIISFNKIAIIKSLTLHKIWILVSKNNISFVDYDQNEIEIVLNFIYKYSSIENNNNYLPYKGYNNTNNLIGLAGDTKYPYFENILIQSAGTDDDNSLLNIQGEYFKTSLFTQNNSSIPLDKLGKYQYALHSTVSDSDLEIHDFSVISTNDIEDYKKSYKYEIYGFASNSDFGQRVFEFPSPSYNYRFEIYTIPSDMVHYIFSYTDNVFDIDSFRKSIYGKVYLGDYDFTEDNINSFSEENNGVVTKYVDLYIPLPKYGDYPKYVKDNDWNNIAELNLTPVRTADIRLSYDPTSINSSLPKNNDPDPVIPYYYSDTGIKTIVDENNNDENSDIIFPVIVTDNMDIADLKDANTYNKYFNIIDSTKVNLINGDRDKNIITDPNINNAFTRFHKDITYFNDLTKFDEKYKILCENLFLLLDFDKNSNNTYISYFSNESETYNVVINNVRNLFFYIESEKDVINITFNYAMHSYTRPVFPFIKKGSISTSMLINASNISNHNINRFIIPCYENLTSININANDYTCMYTYNLGGSYQTQSDNGGE